MEPTECWGCGLSQMTRSLCRVA